MIQTEMERQVGIKIYVNRMKFDSWIDNKILRVTDSKYLCPRVGHFECNLCDGT